MYDAGINFTYSSGAPPGTPVAAPSDAPAEEIKPAAPDIVADADGDMRVWP